VCWYMGMQRIGAERATLFSGLIPVAAAGTAPLVGTGSYGLAQAAGSAPDPRATPSPTSALRRAGREHRSRGRALSGERPAGVTRGPRASMRE
jgi:hypothetical protein